METLKVPVTLPTLMNSSQMAEVCIINRKIKYANEKFRNLIGYSSDELLEMSENKITRLVDPKYRVKFSRILDTMKCPQSFLKDILMLKKNSRADEKILVDMYFRCLLHREDKEVLMISLCDKTEEFQRFNESPNLIFDWKIFREKIDISVVNLIGELVKDAEKNIDRLIPYFDGTIENSNKLTMDTFRFPGNVTRELTIFNAVDDDDDYRLKIIDSISEILSGKISTSVFRTIDKTNKVFDLEVQSKLISNRYPYIVRSIGRDLSEVERKYSKLIEEDSNLTKKQERSIEIQKLNSLSESTISEVRRELQSLVGLVEQFGLLEFISMDTRDSVLMLQNRTRNRIEKIGLILKDYYERTSGNIDEDKFIPLGNKELILLASSDAEFIDHMKPYLVEKNYTPLISMNNESMFKSLDELKPDMVILNFDSPLDLLPRITKNGGKRKVIVLTSNPKIQTSQYIEAGAIDTIKKPVFGPELLKTIYYSLLK